jgi:tRNA A-37 threonylcarbamoyl transferase component Bud32
MPVASEETLLGGPQPASALTVPPAADLAAAAPLAWLAVGEGEGPHSAEETMQRPPTAAVPREPPPPSHQGEPTSANGVGPATVSFLPQSPATAQPHNAPTRPALDHGPETLASPTMATPSQGAPASPPAAPDFPTGYEIEGLLGRGGMGVVYKARQKGLNRSVALKMIVSGGHATPEELMRFKIEAEAVARLQHPNIVQVFDTGLRDGRPYFSLEYCEGGSLQQRLDGTPMPPAQAAGLIETLAKAMHFAHQRGIVHRDLKPANVLLTADGTPKITDFGLAKRLGEDQGHTGTQAILGTPTYMAPEQASGRTKQVGPAADIYALGAVLYDMLTGRPPFRGATALDTLQMVQSAEPIPPARLQPGVPGDLQTICLKCLEKDAEKRYATAGDLAADLRRFLEHRPIQARPATALERAWKWARRRPAAAALVAVAAFTPVAVTAASLLVAGALYRKNEKIEQAAGQIQQQNKELEQREQALTRTSRELESTVGKLRANEKVLEDQQAKLQSTNNALREALERVTRAEREGQQDFLAAQQASEDLIALARREFRKPGFEAARGNLLRRAVAMCKRFTARPGDHPAAQLRAARAHRLLGDLEALLGKPDEAVKNFDEAVGYYEALLKRGKDPAAPDADYEAELLDALMRLWGVLEGSGDGRADSVLTAIEGRLGRLAPEKRALPTYRRIAGLWRLNRAIQQQLRDRPERAREDYDRALVELRALADRDESKVEVARVLVNRATLLVAGRERLTRQGGLYVPPGANLRQAQRDCEDALALLRPLLREDDVGTAEVLGQAYRNLGLALALAKENESARQQYEAAVGVFDDLSHRVPLNPDFRHLLAVAQADLGTHLMRTGRREQGQKLLAQGRATLEQLADSFRDAAGHRLDLARLATSEGLARIGSGDLHEAEGPLTSAVELLERAAREQPQRGDVRQYLLISIRNLIFCHDRLARLADLSRDPRSAARHVGQLARLRRLYEESLPSLPPQAPAWQRLARFGERLLLREELSSTLRAQAKVLAAGADHRGAAHCVEEMRPLLAADWPGWVESAALLSRCIALTEEDARVRGPEQLRLARRYGKLALEILTPLARRGDPDLSARLEGLDFDPLRRLYKDDFQRLEEELSRPGRSGPP